MTYALHTKQYTMRDFTKLEQFQNNCIRQIEDPKWYKRERKLTTTEVYKKYKQPLVKTWIQKMAITHHLHQTTTSWNIHPHTQKNAQQREQEWQQEWRKHKLFHYAKTPS